MIDIFTLSIKDFWTKKFILLSIFPLILTLIFFSITLNFAFSEFGVFLTDSINSYIINYPIIYDFFNSEIIKWILSAILYAFTAYLVVVVSLFFTLIIVGFLTPIVVDEINKRHYKLDLKDKAKTALVFRKMATEFFKFIGILLVCLPLIFIPFLNFLFAIVPFFYIYYKFLLIDISSNILNEIKFNICYIEGGKFSFALACFFFYILSLVPFVGLFFQLFFMIFLTHLIFKNYLKV